MAKGHWLYKTEPDVYSIEDLRREGTTLWEGVRNYTARIHLRAAKVGDEVFVHHSNGDPSGIAGLAVIAGIAEPDPLQFDPESDYFEPKTSPEDPRWVATRVRFVEAFPRVLPLEELRGVPALAEMELLRKGSRLSIQPVSAAEAAAIRKLAAKRARR